MNRKDLEPGTKFGKLEVIEKDTKVGKHGQKYYICRCECGNTISVTRCNLSSGHTKSCGCLSGHKENPSPLKDNDPLYKTWVNAKTRCYNPKSVKYPRYGARGIRMCDEWLHDFPAFYKWANDNGYKPGLQLDRRDNDGNYCPENCRFVTRSENMRNTGSNILLTFNGVTKTQAEWGEELYHKIGANHETICKRLTVLHWSVEKALTEPSHSPITQKRLKQAAEQAACNQ